MSQQIRLEYPGALWHVVARGTNCKVFRDDLDRKIFLKLLGRCVQRAHWTLIAYVLLPAEFRLLIRLESRTLSRGMQWLNGVYAQRFNRRHGRVGHLFHGRFDARLIDEESKFGDVVRDIVLAPVRAGLVNAPEQYRWSSHAATIGQTSAPQWLAVGDTLRAFDKRRVSYRAFVDAGLGVESRLWDRLVGDIYLGRAEWLKQVRKELAMKPRSDSRSRMQRTLCTIEMPDVVGAVAQTWSTGTSQVRNGRGGVPRMVAAWLAANETLLTNRQIASGLRLRSSARVTALIRNCDKALDQSARLRHFVDRSISTLRRKM